MDEVWSLSKQQAKNLKDGFIPTTTTRLKLTGVRPQIWWTSTEGNASSEYFNDRLDRLRAGDIPDRTAFFDFGIPFDATRRISKPYGDITRGPVICSISTNWPGSAVSSTTTRRVGRGRSATSATPGSTDRAIDSLLWADTMDEPVTPEHGMRVCFGVGVPLDATHT